MKDITKKYTNGEVTIVWKPNICIHSTMCFNGLGNVFDPQKRPWITPEGGTTEQIIDQVKKCPSGALRYYLNSEAGDEVKLVAETIVETMPNGPLLVYGNVTVKDQNGILQRKITSQLSAGVGDRPTSRFAMDRTRKLVLKVNEDCNHSFS